MPGLPAPSALPCAPSPGQPPCQPPCQSSCQPPAGGPLRRRVPAALLLAGGLIGMVAWAGPARAAEPARVLAEPEVTLQRLKELYTAAFLKVEIDEDGDLRIDDDGIKTFVRLDAKRQLVTYLAAWRLKASVPQERKLQWVNSLNQELVMVRFSVPRPDSLVCDYQFFYEGGVTPYGLVHHYRQFVKVARGAVTLKDPDRIVGSDAAVPAPTATGI